eukprot:GABV01000338.1.p1 GENE.GABV01000338.1~~GABV01000338.1.p1  ORF type:complete len:471 (+),score=202.47 GABV01000338.1:2-1414(+)
MYQYKYRFPRYPEQIDDIHDKVGEALYETCAKNGGLYIKLGQGIAAMGNVLPKGYASKFEMLQDRAPIVSEAEVLKLFQEEFGKNPDELFDDFDLIPVASASIAQVHRARLKSTGEWVAVKVQKPDVRKQMSTDFAMQRLFAQIMEWSFGIPLLWSLDYTIENLSKEVNFLTEAKNSERAAEAFRSKDFSKREQVYVPRVHWDISTERVLVQEWIDGIKLTNLTELADKKFSTEEIMEILVEAFSHQIFISGFVHCDPHPGNVLIRRNPRGKPQIVLLDHGLYIAESEKFRLQYCRFWEAMFLRDTNTLKDICVEWGIGEPELFASASLIRPYSFKEGTDKKLSRKAIYNHSMEHKKRVANFFKDEKAVPRELVFVGRNMNIVRSNNKSLGTPVNRIGIMVRAAVKGGKPLDRWAAWKFEYKLTVASWWFWFMHLAQSWSSSGIQKQEVELDKEVEEAVQKANQKDPLCR